MSSKKQIIILEKDDRKCANGSWARYWTDYDGGTINIHHTRAAQRWAGVLSRCKKNKPERSHYLSYAGCSNGFYDFQSFADWCNSQPGYMEYDQSGRALQLDKDIIKPFNKVYSGELCCFVPQRINSLMLFSGAARSSWPIGVNWHKGAGQFIARVGDGAGGRIQLGLFRCPNAAHRAWQKAKVKIIRDAAESIYSKYKKAAEGLFLHADIINHDFLSMMETKR